MLIQYICKITLEILCFPEVKKCDSGVNNIPLYPIQYSLVNRIWGLGWLYNHIEVYFFMLVNEII